MMDGSRLSWAQLGEAPEPEAVRRSSRAGCGEVDTGITLKPDDGSLE